MGDLISRSAVIDVLKETGIIQDNDLGHLVVEEINRIPTAYNVEKDVAELEKEIQWAETHGTSADFRKGRISGLKTAIRLTNDIVKRGGVDERT